MNIKKAAELSGLPAKTIRYYEDIGIVSPARSGNGYRNYSSSDIHQLAFVQRARSLGFTIQECKLLLSLYGDDQRASADVKALAVNKIKQIDRKILELRSLKNTLSELARHCHGDNKPECPILDDLAGDGKVSGTA